MADFDGVLLENDYKSLKSLTEQAPKEWFGSNIQQDADFKNIEY